MDLSKLSPADIASLKTALGIADLQNDFGRSPMRPRQLTNLTLLPTAKDPRPTFFWSADAPRDGMPEQPSSARLLFHQTSGQEITVYSDEEEASYGSDWGRVAPRPVVLDPMAQLQAALESLSPEDRALLIESQKQDRISALKNKLSVLDPNQIDALIAAVEPKKVKRTA